MVRTKEEKEINIPISVGIIISLFIILLLIFVICSYIYTFIAPVYQIEDQYEVFKDLLIILLTIAGIVMGTVGYVIYRQVLERIENKVRKNADEIENKVRKNADEIENKMRESADEIENKMRENADEIENEMRVKAEMSLDWGSALTLYLTGYTFWRVYENTKQNWFLEPAIHLTEKAYERMSNLDEQEPKNEFLKCGILNNLGYYLAERKRGEDREFAIDCAKYIRDKIQKYPDLREKWQDTYDFIFGQYT